MFCQKVSQKVGRYATDTHLGRHLSGGLDADGAADATAFDHDSVVLRRISVDDRCAKRLELCVTGPVDGQDRKVRFHTWVEIFM